MMNEEENTNTINLEQFTTIYDSLTLFKIQITNLQKVVKNLEKDVRKEFKNKKKETEKKEIKNKNKREPSGFAKPTKVTKELCEFMNKPEGTEIARTEVTKALINYIKNNNLIEEDTENKNKIVPDEKLKNLLGLNDGDNKINELTYFTIQKYMNKHFPSKKIKINLDA